MGTGNTTMNLTQKVRLYLPMKCNLLASVPPMTTSLALASFVWQMGPRLCNDPCLFHGNNNMAPSALEVLGLLCHFFRLDLLGH